MFKLMNLIIFMFCIICNLYAIDLEYVKAHMDKTQDIQFIGNVPLLTYKETQTNSKLLYSDDEQSYYIKFKLKDNFKKEDIKHILINYNPQLFNSINLIKINATKNELSKIVDSVKDFADIEYLQSNFAKRRPNDFITKVVEDVGKVQLDESLFDENKEDIHKNMKQAPAPVPVRSGGIGSSSTTDNDILTWTPNDPDFKKQWYLYNKNNRNTDLKYLEFHKYVNERVTARKFSKGLPVIAYIDLGFFTNFDDLKDKVFVNTNEIPNNGKDDDRNGYIDDYRGVDVNPNHQVCTPNLDKCIMNFVNSSSDVFTHGFAMTSISGAIANNNKLIAGLGPGAIRVLPISTEASEWRTSIYYMEGYDYVLDMKKRGFNIIAVSESLGGPYVQAEYDIIKELRANNIVLFASAGNDNNNIDIDPSQDYPAAYELDNIVSVGAYTVDGVKASFSNYGNKNVDIYMPGRNIPTFKVNKEGIIQLVYSGGTSQAASVASALFSNAYWLFPDKNVIRMKNDLLKKKHSLGSFTVSNKHYYLYTVDLTDVMHLYPIKPDM